MAVELSVNTNMGAQAANRYLSRNTAKASAAANELSSGIVTYDPSKKPSEAAIGARLDAKISNLSQATKNANQLIALIQMGTGTLDTMQNVITRMQSLASQSNNDALDAAARSMLNEEYSKLLTQLNNLSDYTRWGNTRLFGGSASSATANGAVTEALTVNAVTNAFTNAYTAGNTQGQIDGIVVDATVTLNQGMFDVSVTFQDGKVFQNTVAAPVAAGVLTLKNNKDGISTIGLTYHATDVSGFDGTAATFQSLLRQHLGITGGGARTVGTSSSIAMYAGVTATPDAAATSGQYVLNYAVANGIGTFSVSNGVSVASTTVTASASISQTISVGNFTLALNAFNGSASLAQVAMTVTGSTTLTMSGQIEDLSTDTIGINFRAINTTTLNLNGTNVTTKAAAVSATDALKSAAATISSLNAQLGGTRSQLDFQIDNLQISLANQLAAKATYTDTDIGDASERLTKFRALATAAQAMLTQALQVPSSLVQILQRLQ